jgi:signal transduction histidine kinase
LQKEQSTLPKDISKQDRAEYLETIIENLSQGILCLDHSGTVTLYNVAAENILQKKRDDVLGCSFHALFADELFGFSMREASQKKLPLYGKKASMAGSSIDRSKTIESDVTFTTDGMIIAFRDISYAVYMESLASKNNRTKERQELAAMIAHEMRNPLGGMKGFATLLMRDLEEHPRPRRLAAHIAEGISDLEHIVNDVLNRHHHLHLQETDLVKLVQELLMHLHADASIPQNITMDMFATASALWALVDPAALRSALLNLCSNSIKAMPKGGKLLIEVVGREHDNLIKITDSGEGISPENQRNLFTPFFTTRPQGHGLGLCEVLEVVQAHHGEIEVCSEVDKGAAFIIKIPHSLKEPHEHR